MPFFNSITLVGYVATDPINRQTSGGKDRLSFRMSYTAWGGAKESAFINVTIWGRPAVSVGAFRGYLVQKSLWGVYPNEAFR